MTALSLRGLNASVFLYVSKAFWGVCQLACLPLTTPTPTSSS